MIKYIRNQSPGPDGKWGGCIVAVASIIMLLATGSHGWSQTLRLRDGRSLAANTVIVRGGQLVRALEIKDGGMAEIGYPLGDVVALDWPEPEELRGAREDLEAHAEARALAKAAAVAGRFEPFAKVPGSWWAEAERLRLQALVGLGRVDGVELAARRLMENAMNDATRQAAQLILAKVALREQRWKDARHAVDSLRKQPLASALEAEAAVICGELRLRESDWEGALESFLQVPAFHPTETGLLPKVLLGSARAYRSLGDAGRAERAALELVDQFPKSNEARQAGREAGL